MTDAVYADDLTITSNNNNDTESMLHKIGKVAKDIGPQVNTDKIEFMSINQKNTIEI